LRADDRELIRRFDYVQAWLSLAHGYRADCKKPKTIRSELEGDTLGSFQGWGLECVVELMQVDGKSDLRATGRREMHWCGHREAEITERLEDVLGFVPIARHHGPVTSVAAAPAEMPTALSSVPRHADIARPLVLASR
jgi:hypothetical protein